MYEHSCTSHNVQLGWMFWSKCISEYRWSYLRGCCRQLLKCCLVISDLSQSPDGCCDPLWRFQARIFRVECQICTHHRWGSCHSSCQLYHLEEERSQHQTVSCRVSMHDQFLSLQRSDNTFCCVIVLTKYADCPIRHKYCRPGTSSRIDWMIILLFGHGPFSTA